MRLKRHETINRDIEKQILIALITSTKVLQGAAPVLDPKLFHLEISQKVARWIVSYYQNYNEAPGRHMQDIFLQEKARLSVEEQEQSEEFLTSLSEEFEQAPPNPEYMLDQALDYLKKRKMAKIGQDIQALIDGNHSLVDAEAVLNSYNQVIQPVSRWVNPFDPKYINTVYENREEPLIYTPGNLGKLIGNIDRGYLMGIMGPMKRGKTWWLLEFALIALMNRRRVAFVGLEMEDKYLSQRFYKRLTAAGDEDRDYEYSVFDCLHNKNNLCNVAERPCRVKEGEAGYLPCTHCRDNNIKDYEQVFTKVMRHRPQDSAANTRNQLNKFLRSFGSDMFRMISYPPYSANSTVISNDMDSLCYGGFIPDVLIVDYSDILGPERLWNDNRHMVDETWKVLKRMAVERKIAIITATQGNRASLMKDIIEQTDVSEDIRKLAHCDIFFALSQARNERVNNTLRLNVLAHRWRGFDPYVNLQVTYNFELGQPMLDSREIWYTPAEEQEHQGAKKKK